MSSKLSLLVSALIVTAACSSDPRIGNDDGSKFHTGGSSSDTGGASTGAVAGEGAAGGSDIHIGGVFGNGGSGGNGGSCVDVDLDFSPKVPTVITLIDQSRSMDADIGGVNRWNAVRDALIGPAGVITSLENSVQFGVMLYTGPLNGNGMTCPLITSVTPAMGNLSAISAMYLPDDWQGETPTGESIDVAVAALSSYSDPKAIILATDGEPDTCAQPNPQNGQPETKAAVSAAYSQGITTYVLSVGSDVSETHLREVANLGQGFPVDDPADRFYRSNSQAELQAAFQTIIDGERTCVFTLNGDVQSGYESTGKVVLDGDSLVYGQDWVLRASDELELVGDACTTVLSGQHDLSISFPCGAVVVK